MDKASESPAAAGGGALVWVASALLVLGSVAVLPGALNRFVLVKVALVAAGAGLALLVAPRGALPRGVWVLLGAAGAILLGAAALGDQPVAQVAGRAPRFEGVLVLAAYVAAGVGGARLWGPGRSTDDSDRLIRLLAGAAVLVGVVAVLEAVGLRPLVSSAYRPGSLLGNASDQGAWALLALGPLAAAAAARLDRWSVSGTLAALACLVTSASRGALVGAGVVLVVLVVTAPKGRSRRVLLMVTAGLAVGAVLTPLSRSRILGGTPLAEATTSGRALLWQESIALTREHLLLGNGPSGFVDAITSIHTPTWYRMVGPQFPPDSPHSWPLQALTAGGLGLLGLAVALASWTAVSGWRQARAAADGWLPVGALAGLAGYGTALLFHFTSPGHTALAAVLGGLLLAAPLDRTKPDSSPTRAQVAAAGLCAALAAVLLAGAAAEIPLRTAVLAASRGKLEQADEAFRAASRFRPWDISVAETAGHAFAVISQVDASQGPALAEPWLDAAARRLPSSSTVAADQALVAHASGHYDLAVRHWTNALALDPNNPDLLLNRGVSHAARSDFAAAAADFETAAAISPDRPEPAANLRQLRQMEQSGELRTP